MQKHTDDDTAQAAVDVHETTQENLGQTHVMQERHFCMQDHARLSKSLPLFKTTVE